MEKTQLLAKQRENKRRYGYMFALMTAILWGLWYVPGEVVWLLNPFFEMQTEMAEMVGSSVGMVITAVLITGLNAITVSLALIIWNGGLGKLGEIKRTVTEFKSSSKWYLLAGFLGGPIAILGSFMAMGFIGGAFAAVAALLYPVFGIVISKVWYGEKISKRAVTGVPLIMLSGVVVYIFGLISNLTATGGKVAWLGYLGGAMAAAGWGTEGAVAGRALEVSEPDAGILTRFLGETLIWWIIIIPLLAVLGLPMFEYALQAFEPIVLLTLVMAGITFGFCYVNWYKSFPLVGVGRGQGVANLYGVLAVIFLFLFGGQVPK
ncbi:MAG: Permease of the drug/metabolite transporter, DMT superfamily [Candidatus Methanohalarchaeum thermophilum]|uniref:Permease of the drug/metabolite transporter, DMT superfamily n=1 Tax=Methanohalarchaeum thermophilum TaxID=1903181 RepID=A0A1Q6DT70_METT1|nr:MAG: Permease of the drug/metabolite transporter, DMT superfamily [Candidatus Methanohalarchaeum thermophilum]